MNDTGVYLIEVGNITGILRNGTADIHPDFYPRENIIDNKWLQTVFCVIYTVIFVLGIVGNTLVCFVVIRNKAMQTVTNLFITNLALSDILLCIFAVPFTPLYTFGGVWNFGSLLCHIMPFAQGCSVYISTLTLMSIAIDRFFVIIYPFRPRMKIETCITVIIMIWIFSVTVTTPYAVFMTYMEHGKFCDEAWPSEHLRRIFGSVTSILQFVCPFIVIAFCYTCVSFKLNDRAKAKAASKNSRKEEIDKYRKRRTNQMLITMVTIFGTSWLPLNVINLCNDYYVHAIRLEYYFLVFFIAHVIAMSSTCYNPFIYAWMNENFRKEFKLLIPCIDSATYMRSNIQMDQFAPCAPEPPFNGNTTTDSYLGSSSQRATSFRYKRKPSAAADVEKSGVELNEDLMLNVDVKHCHISTSYNLRRESVKLRLINEESFDATPTQSQI
ncbi:Neuropeptide Y receptor type 2 [Eumeta japonica]|uniref:Neuropeptide Y receptor type 2 n=1 Tax=Eumeta variegata TaxID=151549 RepID=A0A4C1U1Q9_EUMVA|nr:Neuropeptide Y receptor type 2 [Eumeta japonica]